MALGPVLGGVLTELVSFRAAYLTWAGLALVILFIGVATRTLPMSGTHGRQTGAPSSRPSLRGLLSLEWARGLPGLFRQIEPRFRGTYLVLVFATFTMMVYRFSFQGLLPIFADAEAGLTPTQVGLLFLIMGSVVMVMVIPAGFVIDKVGRKWATVPSTGIPAIAFLLIPFADSFWTLAAIMVFMGLANGLSLGSVAVTTYDVIPASARGRLQALRRTVAEVGGIGGPALGGAILSISSAGVPFLVFAPLLVVASLLLGFVAKETLVKKPRLSAQQASGQQSSD